MICCVIAAYIYAQIVAALRRWCIYWGLMRRGPYDRELPTFFSNLRGAGPRPAMSTLALTAVFVGLSAMWAGGGFERSAADAQVSQTTDSIPRLSQLIGLSEIRP